MISRLTAFAATFAVLATTTLALAATSVQRERSAVPVVAKAAVPIVQFETVVVVGHRKSLAAK